MIVKKFVKGELKKGEQVLIGAVNVNISDGAGTRNEIRIGTKYIVSGDYIKEFFEKPKTRALKPVKEE